MKHTHLEGRRYINVVRCSSDQQADTSPVDQLRVLNNFAAISHMTHAGDDVVLEGVSGSLPGGRTDIEQVIARKRARDDFDVLLVQDISRFTRGGIDHVGKLKWDLGVAGVEVVFVTQGTTGDLDDDSLIQSIGAYSAQRQAKGMSYAATRGQMSSIAAGNIPHTFAILVWIWCSWVVPVLLAFGLGMPEGGGPWLKIAGRIRTEAMQRWRRVVDRESGGRQFKPDDG